MKILNVAALVLSIFGATAYADQCSVVSAQAASKAIDILDKSPYIIRFCKNCGETVAQGSSVEKVRAELYSIQANALLAVVKIGNLAAAVAALRVDANVNLKVDNKAVDLAYLYVIDRTNNNAVTNLGALAGCNNNSSYYLPEQQSAQVLLQLLLEERLGVKH